MLDLLLSAELGYIGIAITLANVILCAISYIMIGSGIGYKEEFKSNSLIYMALFCTVLSHSSLALSLHMNYSWLLNSL